MRDEAERQEHAPELAVPHYDQQFSRKHQRVDRHAIHPSCLKAVRHVLAAAEGSIAKIPARCTSTGDPSDWINPCRRSQRAQQQQSKISMPEGYAVGPGCDG